MGSRITKLYQCASDDCVAACVAMLAGMTQEEYENSPVIQLFRKEYSEQIDIMPIARILSANDWFVTPGTPFSANELRHGLAYILIVPSLCDGPDAGMHAVVLDLTGDEILLHDPSEGYGKYFYVLQDYAGDNPNAVKIKTWVNGVILNDVSCV